MKHLYKIYYSAIFIFILLNIPMEMKATHMLKPHYNEKMMQTDFVPPLGVQFIDTLGQPQAFRFVHNPHEEQEKPKVNIYPNPTSGEFTLEVNDDRWRGGKVNIYNVLGQEVMQESIVLGESKYDFSTASQGVYFLTLQNGDLKKTLRFMKR